MLRFLVAVAVVLAVLAAGALLVAAAASRLVPLAAKLEARWARRHPPTGTARRRDGEAAGTAGGDTATMLAAMQADDLAPDGRDDSGGSGDGGGFRDGGGGFADGGGISDGGGGGNGS